MLKSIIFNLKKLNFKNQLSDVSPSTITMFGLITGSIFVVTTHIISFSTFFLIADRIMAISLVALTM